MNQLIYLFGSSLSYVVLIFLFQPSIFTQSSVQPSLHTDFHHQLVFAKFDLSIHYLPPYEKTVWYYNRAIGDLIRRAIDQFDWDKELVEIRTEKFDWGKERVAIFMDTLKNIMRNFSPKETMICDDRDSLGTNKEIKELIEQKKTILQTIYSK